MNIAVGCDRAGYALKLDIMDFLKERGLNFTDCGCFDEAVADYPVYAERVAEKILSGECEKGVLICGTGIGVSIAANRHKGIRAANCSDVFSAKATRLHNDANILALGARVLGAGLALEITSAFLDTDFSGEERHSRRIAMLDAGSGN
jgi:ribose 5-phosphate isomerase B